MVYTAVSFLARAIGNNEPERHKLKLPSELHPVENAENTIAATPNNTNFFIIFSPKY
jgi:hypothetical protein